VSALITFSKLFLKETLRLYSSNKLIEYFFTIRVLATFCFPVIIFNSAHHFQLFFVYVKLLMDIFVVFSLAGGRLAGCSHCSATASC